MNSSIYTNRNYKNTKPNMSDKRPEPDTLPLSITALLLATIVISALTVPLMLTNSTLTSPIAIIACILCCGVLFLTSKKTFSTVIIVIIAISSISALGTPVPVALILGGIVSVGGGASFISSAKGSGVTIPLLLPIVMFLSAFAITKDPLVSLSALLFVPTTLCLGLTTRYKASANISIICCTAVTVAIAAALGIWGIYSVYGSFNTDTVNNAITDIKTNYIQYLSETFKQLGQGEFTEPMREEISQLFDAYVNMLPGTLIMVCLVVGYATYLIRDRIFESNSMNDQLKITAKDISVSTATALVFVAAHILSFTSGSAGDYSLLAVVANNICFILMPCLILTVSKAFKAIITKMGFFGLIAIALLIFAIFFFSESPIAALALISAFYIIIASVDVWAKDFYGKGENK